MIRKPVLLGCVCLFLFQPEITLNAATTDGASTVFLAQIEKAIAGRSISQVQLSGNAVWYAGNGEDSGTATLTSSADGSTQMQLELPQKGPWSESQAAIGPSMSCAWSDNGGIEQTGDQMNCLRPMGWLLPTIALQAAVSSGAIFTDLGVKQVDSSTCRSLEGIFVPSSYTGDMATQATDRSKTDICLDPSTLLPAGLSYHVHPDNGLQTNIFIQIRYSDYRTVDGAVVPFLIQRYVNGALQLEIHVDSVQIS